MKGKIAAGHEFTAKAAARILESGGNAFDAAIAAFFASFITEPCMSSAGGGAFANILTADNKSYFVDFFCQTPSNKKLEKAVEFEPMVVNFGETSETFYLGMGSIAVPGTIAGLYEIHEKFAKLPLMELIQPALEYARDGVVINGFQYFDICVLESILSKEAESRSVYYSGNRPLQVGDLIKMPKMADYLEFLIKEGKREFYEGEFARKLVNDCSERGGYLSMDDMKNYKAIVTKALKFRYRDHYILTNPMPSLGGTLLSYVMKALEQNFDPSAPYEIFSKAHVHSVQKSIEQGYAYKNEIKTLSKKWGSTSHFNILDKEGNAINITMSNGEGSGYMVKDTNIMLNNMLGETSLLPNGLHSWEPSRRLASMMSPTIVTDLNNSFRIALGTGGGSRIPSMIAQVLHYLIDFEVSTLRAVQADRMHNEYLELNLEPAFVGKNTRQNDLEVVNWNQKAMFFGGVHTISRKNGQIDAVADSRREGHAIN